MKAKRRSRGNFPNTHACMLLPVRATCIQLVFLWPHSGEKVLLSSGHRILLAPVARHLDAGERLAGLDILLACSRMPHVSDPMSVIPLCLSFSASSDLWGSIFRFPKSKESLSLFLLRWGHCREKSLVCVQRRVPGRFFQGQFEWKLQSLNMGGSPVERALVRGPGATGVPGWYTCAALCWAECTASMYSYPSGVLSVSTCSHFPAATLGLAASETWGSTRIAREELLATLTACFWETITFISILPRLWVARACTWNWTCRSSGGKEGRKGWPTFRCVHFINQDGD